MIHPGVNTGTCILGDADCDGNPGGVAAELQTLDASAVDAPLLRDGEYSVLFVNFAADNARTFGTDRSAA